MKRLIILLYLLLGGWVSVDAQPPSVVTQVDSLLAAADAALEEENYSVADSLAAAALALAQAESSPRGQANSYRTLGYYRELNDELPVAHNHYSAALQLYRELGDSSAVAKVLRDLAIVKDSEGNEVRQLIYARQAYYAVANHPETEELRASMAIDFANICKDFGNFEEAERLYREALRLLVDVEESSFLEGTAKYGLAKVFHEADTFPPARSYAQQSIRLFTTLDNPARHAQAENLLGAIYLDSLKYLDSAEHYFQLSYERAELEEDDNLIYDALLNLVLVAIKKDEGRKAKTYYRQADRLYRENPDYIDVENYRDRIRLILDRFKSQKTARLYAYLWVCSIIFLGFVFYGLYLMKKQRKSEIELKLAEQKQEQLEHEQEIDRLMDEVNRQAEIAREEGERAARLELKKLVHNTVGSQLAATKWTIESYITSLSNREQSVEEPKKIFGMVNEAYRNSRNIERLLARDHRDWLGELEEFFSVLQGFKDADPAIEFQRHGLDMTLPMGMGREVAEIVKIALANVLAHAQATRFSCQITLLEKELIILVEDNGTGFDVDAALNSDNGNGVKNLHQIVHQLNGKLHIDSLPGRGTTISITLPLPEQA